MKNSEQLFLLMKYSANLGDLVNRINSNRKDTFKRKKKVVKAAEYSLLKEAVKHAEENKALLDQALLDFPNLSKANSNYAVIESTLLRIYYHHKFMNDCLRKM